MQEKEKMPVKTYYLVHIYFEKQSKNTYVVYEYQKSRRFTARQAWHHICHEQKKIYDEGILPNHATIFDYCDIIQKLNLDERFCDRYCTFGFIE